jgi:tetratricopeptide (TPR) repeat protein
VGAGNLKVNFALYQADIKREMNIQTKGTSESNVHNEFLQIWAECGTFGLLSFLSIFIFWYVHFIRKRIFWIEEKNLEAWGTFAALSAFFFFSLTNFPYDIVPNALLVIFLLSSSTLQTDRNEKKKIAEPPEKKPLLSLAAFVFFLFVFYQWIFPLFIADVYRLKGGRFQAQKDYGKAILFYQKAIQKDFVHSERTAYELGECFRTIGEYFNALQAYSLSVQLRHYGEVYNNMGNCYYLLNQRDEAAKNWEKAIYLGLPDPQVQKEVEKNLSVITHLKPI